MADIWDGIIIGGAGGAIGGLTVSFVLYMHNKALELLHKHRIYAWMKKNTGDKDGEHYRSTRAIVSWNNLPEDRVRYICTFTIKFISPLVKKLTYGVSMSMATDRSGFRKIESSVGEMQSCFGLNQLPNCTGFRLI